MALILFAVGIVSSITFGSKSNGHDDKKIWEVRERNVIDVAVDIGEHKRRRNCRDMK